MSEDKPVSDWASDFDVFSPEYTQDPAPIWKELHGRCPVAHTERGGGLWMSTKYDDARDLCAMPEVMSNRQVSIVPLREGTDLLADYHTKTLPPVSADPPEHTPLRRLILPFFSPKAVEKYRAHTEQLCNDLIDTFIETGQCDAAVDYAQQITPRVIGHLLGIDTSRSDEFTRHVSGLMEEGVKDPELRAESMHAMQKYFADLISERRQADDESDDYVAQLMRAEVDGKPMSDKLLVNYCVLLLLAGIDTTWSALGSALWHFATNPDDRRRLASEEALFPTAIEEILRYYAPVSVGRVAMDDVTLHENTIKRGERMMINFPAANRDPEAFEQADEFMLDRERNRHLAFGVGIHRCVGSNLARMEMDVALRAWFARIPEFELTDPDAVTWAAGQIRGARNVPVKFKAG